MISEDQLNDLVMPAWKKRLLDENRYLIMNGLNHVVERGSTLAEVMQTLERFKDRPWMHLRVYREVRIGNQINKK